MTTYNVSELEGVLLDAAVAKAQGWVYREVRLGAMHVDGWGRDRPGKPDDGTYCLSESWVDAKGERHGNLYAFCPSRSWYIAGPIIERERIMLTSYVNGDWEAFALAPDRVVERMDKGKMRGPTPLIAAMRAYVVSKLGPEVDL